ncbi:MAG: DUF4253 domain-containing protein [Woeseiaceae bacterium]|nr:DUF4253 domain-containing protein [Woeseiaceae bacterium]
MMKTLLLTAALSAVLISGCDTSASIVELNDEEAALFSAANIDGDSALQIRRHGSSVERLQGLDENWEYYDAEGVVLLTNPDEGESTLESLRVALDSNRYAVYLLDQGFGYGPDSIAILANTDPWFYLGTVKINGINYDIEHDDVIQRLRKWDSLYGLRIIGGGMDWLHARFDKPPKDWTTFAHEVYEFCPDVVDQGTGSVDALALELEKMRGVYLWWD